MDTDLTVHLKVLGEIEQGLSPQLCITKDSYSGLDVSTLFGLDILHQKKGSAVRDEMNLLRTSFHVRM